MLTSIGAFLKRFNLRKTPKKVRDGSNLVVIINNRFPHFVKGKEEEVRKKVISMYEDGSHEREIGLAIIIDFGLPCGVSVIFMESEILLEIS